MPDLTFSEMKFLSKYTKDNSKERQSRDNVDRGKKSPKLESHNDISECFKRARQQDHNNDCEPRRVPQHKEPVPESLMSTLSENLDRTLCESTVQQRAPAEFDFSVRTYPLPRGCADVHSHNSGEFSESATPYTWSESSQDEDSHINPSVEAYVRSLLFDGLYSRSIIKDADVPRSSKVYYDLEDLKAISNSREEMRKLEVGSTSPNNARISMWSSNWPQSAIDTSAKHAGATQKRTIDAVHPSVSPHEKPPYPRMSSNLEHVEPLISDVPHVDIDRSTWNIPSPHGNNGRETFSYRQSSIYGGRSKNAACSEHPVPKTKPCPVREENMDYDSRAASCGGDYSIDSQKGYSIGHIYIAGSMVGATEDPYQEPLLDGLSGHNTDRPGAGKQPPFDKPLSEKSIRSHDTSSSSLFRLQNLYNPQCMLQSNSHASYGTRSSSRPLSHSLQYYHTPLASFTPPIGFRIRPVDQLLPSWSPSLTIGQYFSRQDYPRDGCVQVSTSAEDRSGFETRHSTEHSYIPANFWRQNRLY